MSLVEKVQLDMRDIVVKYYTTFNRVGLFVIVLGGCFGILMLERYYDYYSHPQVKLNVNETIVE